MLTQCRVLVLVLALGGGWLNHALERRDGPAALSVWVHEILGARKELINRIQTVVAGLSQRMRGFLVMSSSRKVVELFYDVVSPYSWLAFEVLCRYRTVWNIELKFKPAYLAGVMHGSGNRPPGMVPNKFHYMTTDLKRLSNYFGVHLSPLSNVFEAMFEKGTLNAMRFVTAVAEKEKEGDMLVERVSRELWKRIWSTDQDITQPASLTEAGLKAGLSANEVEEILTLSKSQPIKDKLKSVTEEALEHKCFGFPCTVCYVNGKTEVFFGSDRFELMAYCIGEKWVGPQPANPTAKM